MYVLETSKYSLVLFFRSFQVYLCLSYFSYQWLILTVLLIEVFCETSPLPDP